MDLGSPDTPRWVQRFEHFDRTLANLHEGIALLHVAGLPDIVREGVVQRFEICWDLAWKTLKDFLDSQKLTLVRITPAEVIRTAFAAQIISDGQEWMDALEARNTLSHEYNEASFEEIIGDIEHRYYALLSRLHATLQSERENLFDA